MNKELHDALSRIDDTMLNIDIKVKAINDKLDELIKALHEYDGDYSNEEYGESSFEAFQDKQLTAAVEEDEFDDYGRRVDKDKNNELPGKLVRGMTRDYMMECINK